MKKSTLISLALQGGPALSDGRVNSIGGMGSGVSGGGAGGHMAGSGLSSGSGGGSGMSGVGGGSFDQMYMWSYCKEVNSSC